jgi:hypothetical protein
VVSNSGRIYKWGFLVVWQAPPGTAKITSHTGVPKKDSQKRYAV